MLMKWPMELGKCTFLNFSEILSLMDYKSLKSDMFLLSDREYPRLGQMIVDYENPLKKMMEEFVPHSKVRADF